MCVCALCVRSRATGQQTDRTEQQTMRQCAGKFTLSHVKPRSTQANAKDHRKDSCEAVNPFIIDWCAQFCGKQTTRRFHCVRWFLIDRLPISMPIFETWEDFFYTSLNFSMISVCHRNRINQSQSTRQTPHGTMLRMCIVTVWLHRPELIGSQKIIWRIFGFQSPVRQLNWQTTEQWTSGASRVFQCDTVNGTKPMQVKCICWNCSPFRSTHFLEIRTWSI